MEFLELRFHRQSLINNNRPRPAWVNDRPGGNQRFHSEPRQRNDGLQSLAPAGAKGNSVAVMSEDGRSILYNSYNRGALNQQGEQVARRQKSLPARKPTVSDRSLNVRKTNSASDKENLQNYRNAKQTVTIYLASPGAKDYELGPETKQVIHGIRTRSHEENYIKSNKFASSWARVRAENLALRDGSPSDMSPTRLSRDESPDSPQRDGSPSKCTDASGGSGGNQGHHRFVLTKPRGRPPNRKHVKPTGKKGPISSYFDDTEKTEIPRRESWEGSKETLGSKSQNTGTLGSDWGEGKMNGVEDEEKGTKRRPAWDNRVNVVTTFQPKVNLRKYESDLTFKPSITTKEEVYMAYTGHDRLNGVEGGAESDDGRYSPLSSDGENSDRSRSNSRSPGRSKERMLNKREARSYLKMTAVYGSDAFKNQRKQWFLDKLALAQEQKAKLEEEMRKAEEKKRVEDRKKQQRQLNYVRDKFRKEQVHRFRTQYVTSRVLEHEQANRHEYGLPEDFDDGFIPNQNDSKGSRSQTESTTNAENSEEMLPNPDTHLNGHISEKGDNALGTYQKRKDKKSHPNVKDIDSSEQQRSSDKKNQPNQNGREEERQKNRQKNEKSWYKSYERTPRADETKPPFDTGNPIKKPPRESTSWKTSTNVKPNVANNNDAGHRKYGKEAKAGGDGRGIKNGTDDKGDDQMKWSSEAENRDKPSRTLKDNNNGIHKTKNQSGRDDNIKDQISAAGNGQIVNGNQAGLSDAKQVHSDNGGKGINRGKKDTGPSLPHTKSHADPDNSKDKKDNAPYIFTGHFRQEADSTYHKINTNVQDKNSVQKSGESPSISNTEESDKTQSVPKTSTTDVPQIDKSGNMNAKNLDKLEQKNPNVPSSVQRHMVQNLINKSKVTNETNTKDSHDLKATSPQNKSRPSNQSNRQKAQSKRKPSPIGPSDSKKSSDHIPAKPSAIALLHVLEEAKPPERKHSVQTVQTLPSIPQSSVKPIPDDKTTNAHSQREEHAPDNRSPNDISSKTVQQRPKEQQSQRKASVTDQGMTGRRATTSSGRSTAAAAGAKKKPRGNSGLAHQMFDVNRGPTWNPHQKMPKMEGIDTVVIETKDGKGNVVKQKKHVKSVVKDAEKLLNAPVEVDAVRKRPPSKRSFRAASPDVTLGSDFDVDDDEEEAVGDIFERLRKKYNIQIDSDEDD
ncbi:hypothetical protein EGW08_006391 [Elysia chlorotica]|uniref:Uncharacterized protein n=1 Tax=Elysia chlorotica TaxID=188477 RepID=A0A3S0ZSL6_ELYCH|nr:hypothetical protein EGW08_006391 [Elysia chlorotica]